MVVPHPFAQNHNGGQLQFGPQSSLLFVATGDGGPDKARTPPTWTSLLGKLIRIDPWRRTTGAPTGSRARIRSWAPGAR